MNRHSLEGIKRHRSRSGTVFRSLEEALHFLGVMSQNVRDKGINSCRAVEVSGKDGDAEVLLQVASQFHL